jgi:hypothetical protein
VEVWVAQLCQRFAQGPIAVALEQSRGALVCKRPVVNVSTSL